MNAGSAELSLTQSNRANVLETEIEPELDPKKINLRFFETVDKTKKYITTVHWCHQVSLMYRPAVPSA